jgi:hypothetical protein
MTAAGPPAGSYNISAALRAFGLRDQRVIPNLGQELTPTVSLGELETFAPEVIEARGVVLGKISPTGGGASVLVQFLSVAPGGIIVENVNIVPDGVPPAGARFHLMTAPLEPAAGFATFNFPPWTIGGQAISTLVESAGPIPGQIAIPAGGSGTPLLPFPFTSFENPGLLGRVWVPPSWWFAVVHFDNSAALSLAVRFREIPQAQGSP